MNVFRRLTLVNKGLRYRLMLAFTLMTIIPLLACMYVISLYIFPQLENIIDISTVIIASLVIAILGLLMAKGLVDPVIDMAIEAKIIASGEYDKKITISSEDEIGNIGQSINEMTHKIRSNIDELRSYGQKMKAINIEIHKKVLSLSSLLQIGDVISAGSIKLEPLLELAVDKAALVFDAGFGALYMPKEEDGDLVIRTLCNTDKEKLSELVIKRDGNGLVERVLTDRSMLVIDKGTRLSKEVEHFKTSYNVKNIIGLPIYSGRRNLGLLILGNRLDDFKYKPDDIDLVKVFAKQITIAIESDILSRKTEELAIKDDLTGLYNKNFILSSLEEEIKRAVFYQRPCSFIVFNVDNFKKFRDQRGELVTEEVLKRMGKLIKDNMVPVAKIARISGDEFAIVLPEKNKKEATNIAEEIRKKVESANLLREGEATVTVSGGVSENPIDGATGDEIFKKAAEAIRQAKMMGKNKVVA